MDRKLSRKRAQRRDRCGEVGGEEINGKLLAKRQKHGLRYSGRDVPSMRVGRVETLF